MKNTQDIAPVDVSSTDWLAPLVEQSQAHKGWVNVWRWPDGERTGWGTWSTEAEAKGVASEWLRANPTSQITFIATMPAEEWC